MLNLNKSRFKTAWRFIFIAALLLGLGFTFAQVQSAIARSSFEALHTVNPVFQKFYDEHGGLRIFGYPLTDLFEYNGFKVQYFQKARFELHPENPPAYTVQLGLLGDELGHGTPPLPPTNIDLIHHYFPETGHTVAFEFLKFYNNNGGLDIFGYPIAEFTFENGYYVQYFQRAKMVWHPEMSGNDRMQLADLGSIHFDVARLPIELKNSTGAALVGNDAPIKVTASVLSPVTGRSGRQTLFVFVTDAQDANVAGVNVTFSVHPVNRPAPFTVIGQTNSDGFISSTFAVDGSNLGQPIIIEVRAVAGTASAATEISYLPWY
ncbi:MAG TPA: hypothetical protein VJ508_11530 [Saprospiraceae bacterium]|nr:hypothetical protein [Saprospiraceae bacterium]